MTMAGAGESRCQGPRLGHGAVITEHWAAMGLYKHQVLPSLVWSPHHIIRDRDHTSDNTEWQLGYFERISKLFTAQQLLNIGQPGPVMGLYKCQVLGHHIICDRDHVTRDKDHITRCQHHTPPALFSSHLMVRSPADNLATLPNVHTLISPSSDIGHNLQDRRARR